MTDTPKSRSSFNPDQFKKQESWFRTEVEFENSFKFWFALMWQNSYIQIFIVAVVLLILELTHMETIYEWLNTAWNDGGMSGVLVSLGTLVPVFMILATSILGFFVYFRDLKKGSSR